MEVVVVVQSGALPRALRVQLKRRVSTRRGGGGPYSDKIGFGTPKNCLDVPYAPLSRYNMPLSIQ